MYSDVTEAVALMNEAGIPVTMSKHRVGRRWISLPEEYVQLVIDRNNAKKEQEHGSDSQ